MNCCENNQKDKNKSEMKGGKTKMNRNTYLWIAIGVMFILALYLTFQVGASQVTQTAASATTTAVKTAASTGMVGGC